MTALATVAAIRAIFATSTTVLAKNSALFEPLAPRRWSASIPLLGNLDLFTRRPCARQFFSIVTCLMGVARR